MKVTRIAYSKNLNRGKYDLLLEQANRLGKVRTEAWQRYGSIKGVGKKDREVRDQWLKEERSFPVTANAWKETLRDAMGDIKACREAAKLKVRQAICRRTQDKEERKRLYTLLKSDRWTEDPYLRRMMRKHHSRGHNRTNNQIIVRSDNYSTFEKEHQVWLKIPGLEPRKTVAVPLDTTISPKGTLRLILRDERVEVHYSIEIEEKNNCGSKTIGVDKGYTEAFVDSDGERYGEELGNALTKKSDLLKEKHQKRSQLKALAKKNPKKRQNIIRHNLGKEKWNRKQKKTKIQIRDIVFKAVNQIVDKAKTIAAEDLTAPMSGKKFCKNINRRLNSWVKGVIAEALSLVSQRRGSTLVHVNPAYTSQTDSRFGVLLGQRKGDLFHCFDGEVLQADMNAARNILARLYDSEIDQWTPFKKVKTILLERTERLRLGLLNQDSSCNNSKLSTESELPNGQLCPRK